MARCWVKPRNEWYLVTTKARAELLAQQNLQRQAYVTYLPLLKCRRRRRGQYSTSIEAFFTGYLFIRLNKETDNWSPIRSTRGVSGIVRFGVNAAVVIPNKLIESLKINEDDFGYQRIEPLLPKKGDRINIIDGPFSGQQGIFQAMKGRDRALLLLDVIGKNTRATLSINDLQIAI